MRPVARSSTPDFDVSRLSLRAGDFLPMLRNCFFTIGLLILMGSFTLQIAGADPRIARQFSDGSLLSQVIVGSIYIIALLIFLRVPYPLPILARSWPIFLVPSLTIISALWAPDPELTLRRSFALLGTTIFALSLASAYDFNGTLRLLIRALVLAMVLSILLVSVFPADGVHQASDAVEPIHVGKWRGIFAHKNVLGAVAGFALSMLVLYGRVAFSTTVLFIGAIAVTFLCLVFANSGTGYTVAFSTTVVGIVMSMIVRTRINKRLGLILFSAAVCAFLSFFSSEIETLALAALGKDPDLTGRTVYWGYVLPFMDDHWILGYGYFSGFLAIGATIASVTMLDFSSTHSGYIDVIVSLGIVGAFVSSAYVLWLFIRAIGLILTSEHRGGIEKTFPFCVVFHSAQFNLVESGFLAGNSLWPLVLSLAAVMTVRKDFSS